jgi:hypothetical protein
MDRMGGGLRVKNFRFEISDLKFEISKTSILPIHVNYSF